MNQTLKMERSIFKRYLVSDVDMNINHGFLIVNISKTYVYLRLIKNEKILSRVTLYRPCFG